MANSNVEAPKKRIRGGTRVGMLGFAVLLDIAPLIGFILAISLVVSMVGGFSAAASCLETGMWANVKCAYAVGTGGAATIAAMMTLPLIAAVSAALAGVLYAAIFTIWFALKGINMWGLTPRRMGGNILTFIGESIPFVNMLPFMTINTYVHIRAADAEDKQRIAAHAEKVGAAYKKASRRSRSRFDRVAQVAAGKTTSRRRRRRKPVQQQPNPIRRPHEDFGAVAQQRKEGGVAAGKAARSSESRQRGNAVSMQQHLKTQAEMAKHSRGALHKDDVRAQESLVA